MIGVLRILPAIALSLAEIGVSGASAPLFGQEPGATNISSLIGTVGVTGVLVWYLWYTTSSAFPKVRQDFRDELESERNHHTEMSEKADALAERLCVNIERLADELRARPCLREKKQEAIA